MANYSKLKVIWRNNLNDIYKDNTIIGVGQEAVINMDENGISNIHVNFKVNDEFFTDLVEINGNIIQVPFKTDVLKAGTHQLEIVAYLRNGDVVPSPTFSYYVEKSLGNKNAIEADTYYPILIKLLEEVEEWNERIPRQEEQRIANENERKSNEINRQSNEDTRLSNENTRQSNESSRQQYETQRRVEEDERLTDEQVRVNAENIRIANENERLRKEIERQNAEELRQIAYNSSLYGRMDETEDRLNEVDSQLAHNVRYIKLSMLGLGTDSFENLNIILSKLTSNNIVFEVDGEYTIATNEIKDLNYDFNLISYNNGSLIFNNSSSETFFNIKASINIENVNFINNTNSDKIIFVTLTNDTVIEKFRLTNSNFRGRFRLAHLNTGEKIKTIEILNNDIRNTKISFFTLSYLKVNSVIIKGNYVENWLYRFFSIDSFEDIENMVICDNTATNTDDWIFDEQVEDGTYYVFALVKAKKIYYTNNYVENIKSRYSVAIYDCYAFANYYVYENNVFKNNACFDTNSENVLMKCKNENSHKTFKNNLFIIEDEFLTKFGVDLNNFKIKLYDIWGGYEDEMHTLPVEFVIENNKIYVPNLDLEEGYRFVKNFIFNNNYIKCRNITDGLVNSKYNEAFIKITNNIFDNEAMRNFALVKGTSNATYSNVDISNNNINTIGYCLESCYIKKCNLSNNIIGTDDTNNYSYLTAYAYVDTFICKDNVMYGGDRFEHNNIGITTQFINSNTGNIEGTYVYLHGLDTTKQKNIKICVLTDNTKSIYNISVLNGVVSCYDVDNLARSYPILSSNGHGNAIKNEGDGLSKLTFYNTTSYTCLSLKTNSTDISNIICTIN